MRATPAIATQSPLDLSTGGRGRGSAVRRSLRGLSATVLGLAALVLFFGAPLRAAEDPGAELPEHRHFVGTSAGMLVNLIPDPPMYYYQLDYGYRVSQEDTLILELIAMGYGSPMGNPGLSGPVYPGSIWAHGVSLAYQRFLWRGLFATIHVTPQVASYSDANGDHLQRGLLLWFQGRIGYQVNFSLGLPFYVEPSIEVNYWPIRTNVPKSFSELDARYPNYLAAPGLNLGTHF